jgi:hypothetical protein
MTEYKSNPIQAREHVIVSVHEYQGKTMFDIRHYCTADDGSLAPTRKGVSVPVDLFREVFQAVFEVVADGKPGFKQSISTGDKSAVIVSVNEYKGHVLLDVRPWYYPAGSNELAPTGKGISLTIQKGHELDDILTHLRYHVLDIAPRQSRVAAAEVSA